MEGGRACNDFRYHRVVALGPKHARDTGSRDRTVPIADSDAEPVINFESQLQPKPSSGWQLETTSWWMVMTTWLLVLCAGVLAIQWLIEFGDLRRLHARPWTYMANAVRLGGCITMLGVAVLVPDPLSVRVAASAAAVALFLIPLRLVVRAGGVESVREIYGWYVAAARLKDKGNAPLPADDELELRQIRSRLRAVRDPRLTEWIDLMVANVDDWIRVTYWPLGLGLRLIRLHELDVELLGTDAPRAELSSDEATFRWRLFRVFARMRDCGGATRTAETEDYFRSLSRQLDGFRRPDTESFIDAVQGSARSWLSEGSPGSGPWGQLEGISALGPAADAAYWSIWPYLQVMWGAELDEEDRALLANSLATHPDNAGAA